MSRLQGLTRPELIFPHLSAPDDVHLLKEMAERAARHLPQKDAQTLFDRLWEREKLGSTGIGAGVAIPHCKMNHLKAPILFIGVTDAGVEFGALDKRPVRIFFLLVSPADAPAEHLQYLAAISKWLKGSSRLGQILEAAGPDEIYGLLEEEPG